MCQVLEVKDKYNTTIQREREREVRGDIEQGRSGVEERRKGKVIKQGR